MYGHMRLDVHVRVDNDMRAYEVRVRLDTHLIKHNRGFDSGLVHRLGTPYRV